MPDDNARVTVLSIESDAFFNMAFENIARRSFGSLINMVQAPVLTTENIASADVIVLPLVRGETYVCHRMLMYRKPGSLVVGVCREPENVNRGRMTNCLQDVILILRSDTLERVRNLLQQAWCRQRGACVSCAGCQPQSLTQTQQQVVERLIRGDSVNQIAERYAMCTKTVANHKYNTMERFGLRNQFELHQLLRCLYT